VSSKQQSKDCFAIRAIPHRPEGQCIPRKIDEKLFDMIMEPQIRRAEKLKDYLTAILDGLKTE
jgi:hypothetical protein